MNIEQDALISFAAAVKCKLALVVMLYYMS